MKVTGQTKELTTGKALPLLLGFTVPILLGNVLQQFYLLTDSAIVSNFLGVRQLAAVGASTSITFLILGFCNGCAGGMAIPVAQAFGARDYHSLRKYVFNSLYLAAALSLALTLVSSLLCRSIIHWINVPSDISEWAWEYLLILFLGIPCSFFYNLLASLIRSLGDSRTPFLFLLFSTSLNIALDLCFILVFKWGVAGAAVATVVAQGVSALLCYRFMMKNYEVLRDCPEDRGVDVGFCRRLLAVGAPMGLQFSITAIGSIMIQSANNALGTVFVAGFAAGMRIKMLFMTVLESLGIAMTTFCGQNLGAGRTDRIMDGIKAGMLMIAVYSAAAFAVIWPLAGKLAMIFVDSADTEIIAAAALYIRFAVCFFFILGTLCLFRYSIQGLGYTDFAMWSGFMEMLARVLVSLFLVAPFGFTAVCSADAIAWIAANLFLVPAFIHVYRKVRS
ncbi:MAG: MATE family efflux transporter [Bacteroidia bacterium]|nr:MATE family efflux transporter [Bacteroidia bacterium]